MRTTLYTKYDWQISFETDNERFYLYKSSQNYGNYSEYNKALEAIKRAEKAEKKKIQPLPIISSGYGLSGHKGEKGKITSIAEGRHGFNVWTSINKQRSKESHRQIKDTPGNESLLKKIEELKNEVSEIEKKIVYYTEHEIRKHFEAMED